MIYFKNILALLFLTFTCYSQQLRFKHITNDDGLSTNYVTAIIQDDKGFMWFGTQDGLNKYDGFNFTIFKNDPTNQNSLSSSEITCLKQIRSDLIVVGTSEGLNFFNPITLNFKRVFTQKNSYIKINAIESIDDNNLIVGTKTGIFIINTQTQVVQTVNFPFNKSTSVKCIKMVNDKIYIGTEENGLWQLNNYQLKEIHFLANKKLNNDLSELQSITSLQIYASRLYIGTNKFGIFKVDTTTFEIVDKILFTNISNGGKNIINDFTVVGNNLHAATVSGYISYNLLTNQIISKEIKQNTDLSFSLNDNYIIKIFNDAEGNLWLGTYKGGINVVFYKSLKFPNLSDNKQQQFLNLYALYETQNGEKWIGGDSVFVYLDANNNLHDYSKIVINSSVLAIFQESETVFWIGTWGKGLIRFDKSSGKTKKFLDKDFGNSVFCLKPDGNGNLFFGTFGDGLFKINLTTFTLTHFGKKEGLPNLNIYTIFSDSKKRVWLGTYTGGLLQLKNFPTSATLNVAAIYKNEGKLNDIASNTVFSINEDKKGNIWVTTSAGLSKLLPNNSFYNFYEKNGLANSYLYSILKDSLNNFWMSSNNGITKFNPLLKESEITFKNYGVKDGLLNSEYNAGAAFVASSGNMYFGGANGYNVFRPSAIKNNLYTPNAYVVGYKRGGKDVITDSTIVYKKYLTLNWQENYFQFELAALDYTDPTKNKFKYMLKGYDNDWSEPTNVRYVAYNELPGGNYTFLVKATNNDGVWNEKPYEISIKVVPPFWKTKLFYLLFIIFSGGLIFAFIQYRTFAVKKENKNLEKKVTQRTKELEAKNKDITSSIEYAKRIQEAILPSKDQIFKQLKNAFILYQPKDIVSGDFYWFAEKNNIKILAVVDCTGHGVPGAFMSMIGHNLLHQIVSEKGITDPAEILNALHKGVQDALRQGKNEVDTNDGMDVSLITINSQTKEVKWAGANRPLITVDKMGDFKKFDGDKYPVGGAQIDSNRTFTTHIIKLANPAMAYLFSDGYADQFGGPKGKKFMVKHFHNLLSTISLKNPNDQQNELVQNFQDWQQKHEQVDDVLVVGLEI